MAMIEKATYIKGLCDGLEIDAASKEGKVIAALVEMVTEMAKTLDAMEYDMDELHDYVEELDEDLGDVEELVYECDDEDDDDCDCCCDCDCDCCDDEDCDFFDDDEEGEFFEVECPSCGDVVNFDSSINPEDLRCPNCGVKFECIVDEDDLKTLDGADE